MSDLREKYVNHVRDITNEKPEYRLGGDGSDGTCDCVGLGIGALRRMGIEYDSLHGSNWAARNEAVELWEIKSVRDLRVGDNVLKHRKPGDPKWDLPDRYASYADQNDYYHFGVIISTNPLQIAHCTSPTTTIDTTLGKWSHAFMWKQLREGDLVAIDHRQVALKSGHLNLRAGPSSDSKDIGDIPNEAVVEVLVDGEWPFVRYEGKCGYVSGDYLVSIELDDAPFVPITTVLIGENGQRIELIGKWQTQTD